VILSNTIKFSILFVLFSLGIYASIFYGGSESLNFTDLNTDFIFYQIRLPKTITAILAGACLAVSGLILQIVFRNPLAGPYVLGISSGASLTVALAVMAGSSISFLPTGLFGKSYIVFASVLGSLVMTILILSISNRIKSNVILLLIGLMFSQICGAFQTVLEYFADPNSLKNFVLWSMGSMSTTTQDELPLFVFLSLLSVASVLFFIKPLNTFLLGENYAHNLGINIKQSRFWLILISSALTGIVTAFCGPIAFIGIAVPILSRMIFNISKQQIHFFSCILIGPVLLLFADAFAHSFIKQMALPINMITTFIGAPLVIYLMFKNKQW